MAEPDGARAVDADGGHQDQDGDDDAAGVGEIDLVLHNVAHADGGAWHLSDAVVELGCFLPEVFSCQALAAASRMRRDRRRL